MSFIKVSVNGHDRILNASAIQSIVQMGSGTSIYIRDSGTSPPTYIQADQGFAHIEEALRSAGIQVIDATQA